MLCWFDQTFVCWDNSTNCVTDSLRIENHYGVFSRAWKKKWWAAVNIQGQSFVNTPTICLQFTNIILREFFCAFQKQKIPWRASLGIDKTGEEEETLIYHKEIRLPLHTLSQKLIRKHYSQDFHSNHGESWIWQRLIFSCPGSSIHDLGQSVTKSPTATLELRHKEWLSRLQPFDQNDV